MSHTTNVVESMNQIIYAWKAAYVATVKMFYPKAKITDALAQKQWSEILKTAYDKANLSDSTEIFLRFAYGLGGFDDVPSVAGFYKNTFGAATAVAQRFCRQGIRIDPNVPQDQAFIILPSGTPYNKGLPLGMQNVSPNVDEIFAVSKDPAAYQIEPLLYFDIGRAFVIKAVPELPRPMHEYALKNNIKLR